MVIINCSVNPWLDRPVKLSPHLCIRGRGWYHSEVATRVRGGACTLRFVPGGEAIVEPIGTAGLADRKELLGARRIVPNPIAHTVERAEV